MWGLECLLFWFGVQGLVVGVQGSGFKVRSSVFGVRGSRCGIWVWDIWGLGSVWCLGFEVSGLGFGV